MFPLFPPQQHYLPLKSALSFCLLHQPCNITGTRTHRIPPSHPSPSVLWAVPQKRAPAEKRGLLLAARVQQFTWDGAACTRITDATLYQRNVDRWPPSAAGPARLGDDEDPNMMGGFILPSCLFVCRVFKPTLVFCCLFNLSGGQRVGSM